ncbi:hypothetical protein SETIT_9G303900v2 [Setaria italica]|uniref:Uncharacterized protein n=1 Tax=Setaria italica TaxID=4555 RepID=A0A368SMB1_SETIT|nr:hypothetical protein SETIT_9G303900v2 [Setaria italica]
MVKRHKYPLSLPPLHFYPTPPLSIFLGLSPPNPGCGGGGAAQEARPSQEATRWQRGPARWRRGREPRRKRSSRRFKNQELLVEVEVTPAEVSELLLLLLLRSKEVDVALGVLAEFLREKKQAMRVGQ